GRRARAPGMATSTRSQRGSVTIVSTRASKSGSPAWPWMTYSALCALVRVPSVRPNSFKRDGLRSITSRAWRPMEPVAPRMTTLAGRVTRSPRQQPEHRHIEIDEDRRKEDRVQAIEHAAVARDEIRRVLD